MTIGERLLLTLDRADDLFAGGNPLRHFHVLQSAQTHRDAAPPGLAVVVDEAVPAQALLEAMLGSRPAVVQDLWLFDLYRGKGVDIGKKSLAFRVVMQDTSKTLTDAEAEAAMAQLLQLLAQSVGAKLRT